MEALPMLQIGGAPFIHAAALDDEVKNIAIQSGVFYENRNGEIYFHASELIAAIRKHNRQIRKNIAETYAQIWEHWKQTPFRMLIFTIRRVWLWFLNWK